jgi:osmotically-inducible protein OsmY
LHELALRGATDEEALVGRIANQEFFGASRFARRSGEYARAGSGTAGGAAMLTRKDDSQIQQDVLRELKWDTRVKETEVGVSVDKGVVTLTGTVNSYGKKVAAEEAAHRVLGVLDVANDVVVRLTSASARTDTDIAHAVRREFEWSLLVPDDRIRSTVADGVVTLEGSVDSIFERTEAERAIRHLAGVTGVRNRIEVTPPRVDADDVRLLIEETLERRADREADRIDVLVEDGTVTLSGRAHSWREKRAILGAVGHAPGVHTVADQLRIDPYF